MARITAILILAGSLFAQFPQPSPSPSGGGGGGSCGSLGGDVTGACGANTVVRIQNRDVAATAPTDGQVYTWNNGASQWQPGTPGGSSPVGGVGAVQIEASASTFGGNNSIIFGNVTALAPAAPSVTNTGTPGVATYSYEVAGVNGIGEGLPSAAGTTTTSQDPPTGSDFNVVHTGCGTMPAGTAVRVYITAAGAMGTTGYIGTTTCGSTLDDMTGTGATTFTIQTIDRTTGVITTNLRGNSELAGPTNATLPTNCPVGAFFTKTGSNAGFYVCTSVDTWTGPLSGICTAGAGADSIECLGTATAADGVAVGNNAEANTLSTVAVGPLACNGNSGNNTVCVGSGAGTNNTGKNGTFLGEGSGNGNTGLNVTALGQDAGTGNTATNLTAVGYLAGSANTGQQITALGYQAGISNTGDNGTIAGYQAGFHNTGANVTLIGNTAGSTNAGNRVVVLGDSADIGSTNGDDSVFIGQGTSGTRFPGSQKAINTSVIIGPVTTTQINNSGGTPLTNVIAINGTATASNQAVLGNASMTVTALFGEQVIPTIIFASLGTPADGTAVPCSDCQVTSAIDDTCKNGGTGAQAFRINSVWRCLQ